MAEEYSLSDDVEFFEEACVHGEEYAVSADVVTLENIKKTIIILKDDFKQAILHNDMNAEWKSNAIIDKRFDGKLI